MRVVLVAQTAVVNTIPDYIPSSDYPLAEADDLAEQSGRLDYLSWDRPNPATANNKGYLANIITQGHFSVLEHASATFYIDGVSRTFTHELVRHRHLSFSEVSQRYVDLEGFDVIVPPALRESWGAETHTLSNTEMMHYRQTMNNLSHLPRKEARQAARAFLPAGLESKILVTGNHRAWRELLPKRLSPSADKEFQLAARKILTILKGIAPNTFQDIQVPNEEI